jgi:ribosomal protein L19
LHSDLLISFYQGVFLPLDHVGFPQKSWIKKVSNGVGKEKKIYAKKWYKKELV